MISIVNPVNVFSRACKGVAIVMASVLLPLSAAGASTSWPERPVTVVVPFAAGGATDIVARLLGQKLSERWGQSVIVENRAGAGGNIGTGIVARAKADGYTLLMASGSNLTINPHLYSSLPFDAANDFTPITNVAAGPMVVAASQNVKVNSLAELIEDAKANPKVYNLGSAGVGSQGHLAGENFQHAAGVQFIHVPYRGESAAFGDLMAGQIDLVIGNIGPALGAVGSGRLKILAVTSKEETPLMPNVPTADAEGVTGFENYGWFGLAAPAGTDSGVVEKIYADVSTALKSEDVGVKLAELGMQGIGNTPAAFADQITTESGHWKTIIEERQITME